MGAMADYPITVHSDYIPRILEVQASVSHVILDIQRDLLVSVLELYGSPTCLYTQEILEWRNREFREYDKEAGARLRTLSGGSRSVPLPVEDARIVQVAGRSEAASWDLPKAC